MLTPHRYSFSESTNKHRVVLKNPSSNTKVNEDTVDVTDDRNDTAPHQFSVENPSTNTNTNNNIENQNQHQHQKDLDENTGSTIKDNNIVSNEPMSPTGKGSFNYYVLTK